MLKMICDICQKPAQCWEFKSKVSIFKRWRKIDLESDKINFDVCDECIRLIQKTIKGADNAKA